MFATKRPQFRNVAMTPIKPYLNIVSYITSACVLFAVFLPKGQAKIVTNSSQLCNNRHDKPLNLYSTFENMHET